MSAYDSLAASYADEHPGEVARIVETAPVEAIAAFLEALEPEAAAAILSRMAPLPAAMALKSVASNAAAAFLAKVEPGTVAAILRRLDPADRETVLEDLSSKFRASVLSLAHHGPAVAGGRLDPRATAVDGSLSAKEVLERVRSTPKGALHYIYVIDDKQRLTGVVNMRELMEAELESRVDSFMTADPDRLRADDPLESIVRHPAWRRVHALPVVDADGRFLGAIRYSTFRAMDAELGRAASGPDPARTASALAELYSVGFGAVTRFAMNVVAGGSQGGTTR